MPDDVFESDNNEEEESFADLFESYMTEQKDIQVGDKIKGEIIVHHNGTAHRCNTNGFTADAEFIDNFGHQPMGHSVGATRAIVGNRIGQGLGFLKCFSHYCSPIFSRFVEWIRVN